MQVEEGQHDSRGVAAFVASDLFWTFADGSKVFEGGGGGGGDGDGDGEEQGDAVQQDSVYSE